MHPLHQSEPAYPMRTGQIILIGGRRADWAGFSRNRWLQHVGRQMKNLQPAAIYQAPDFELVAHRIAELSAEFPRYGYRRVTRQLRAEGLLVNHNAVARMMRESGLQVRPLRRFVRTTQSDHQSPIFLNLMQGFTPTGPDQVWVADLTYIALAAVPPV